MTEAVLSALRPCARPPFAMKLLHQHGPDQLLYHCPKPQPGGNCAGLLLTPLELIDRIAALVPPPRRHRLRYFGALARWPPLWDQPLWDQRDVADTFDTDELILIPKPPEFPFDQRIDW